MTDFVESTKEASRGGFQGIKKIRGLLVSLTRVPPPDGWDTKKWQIEGKLEDAAVLEMFPGEDEFELRDNRYSFLIPYAEEGKKPHVSSGYMKGFVASAEKMGRKPSDFVGEYVTLDKLPIPLFKTPKKGEDGKLLVGKDGEKVYEEVIATNTFSFVPDEASNPEGTRTYIANLVLGLNEQAALRKLLVDTQAKQHPELKDALKAGTLAELLDLTVVEGVFTKAG